MITLSVIKAIKQTGINNTLAQSETWKSSRSNTIVAQVRKSLHLPDLLQIPPRAMQL